MRNSCVNTIEIFFDKYRFRSRIYARRKQRSVKNSAVNIMGKMS